MNQRRDTTAGKHRMRTSKATVASGYARYVGRVGALAVALGVGAAVGTMPGIAYATPDTSSPSDTAGSPISSPDPTGATDSTSAPSTPSTDSPSPSDPAKSDPGTGLDPAVPSADSSQATVTVGEGSSPTVTVSGSGGANTTVGDKPATTTDADPSADVPSATPSTEAPHSATVTPETPAPGPTPEPTVAAKGGDPRDSATGSTAHNDPVSATTTVGVRVAQSVAAVASGTAAPKSNSFAPQAFSASVADAPKAIAADTETTGVGSSEGTPQPEPVAVTKLVTNILSPLLSPSPNTPAAPALMWAVLAFVRREIDRTTTSQAAAPAVTQTLTSQDIGGAPEARMATFAAAAAPVLPNKPPTAAPTFGEPDLGNNGAVTGNLNATDPNGDALTYTIGSAPKKGNATVTETGGFIYTPTPEARHAASGTPKDDFDQFTVTIRDGRGGSKVVTVTNLPVAPTNDAPVDGRFSVTQVNTTTGVVQGTVAATDPESDTLTYKGTTTTAKGKVTVAGNGSFTYTPTAAARHAAAAENADPTALTDSFTVTASDGHGGTLDFGVDVTIVPGNKAPSNGKATVGQPDSTTGVVTGTVTAVDGDNDSLTYSGPTSTAKGDVVVNSNGSFTYTPTKAARHNAASGGAAAKDTFTVTVDDGHGGTRDVAVNVAISPNRAPVRQSTNVGRPDLVTGVVTGSVTATDPDRGDTVTYSGTADTEKGHVDVATNGTFTYTPTDEARAQHVAVRCPCPTSSPSPRSTDAAANWAST